MVSTYVSWWGEIISNEMQYPLLIAITNVIPPPSEASPVFDTAVRDV